MRRVKAIIMAGGVGSRLRPMTCDCPKPMVPLLDKPVMEYAIQLLRRHGVREAAATLCYLPERVRDAFGDGSGLDVALRYYVETEPLGTAGGVKRASEFLNETFCVLSGDGLTDCDLSSALSFHREKKALATIVCKRADAPTEYGVAVLDTDGRVRRFLEKPDWNDVCSDLVNTGIYILEPEALRFVPDGCPYDFARQLFPALMRAGLAVYGWEMSGYWCDIGDVDGYLRAHRDFLAGRIGLDAGLAKDGLTVRAGARVHEGADLTAPCYIGAGAVVENGARVEAYGVVGAGAHIGRGASVKRAVLWPGARLLEGAQASGCVLADDAELGERACAYETSVLGSRSALGPSAALMPGVKVWPRKSVDEYVRVETDIVWGGGSAWRFRDGWIACRDARQAVLLGETLADRADDGFCLTGRDVSAGSAVCLRALTAGLCARGVRVYDAGAVALPALREYACLTGASRAVYICDGRVYLMLAGGLPYPRTEQRALERLLGRERVPTGFSQTAGAPQSAGRADLVYIGGLGARFSAVGKVAVWAASGLLLGLAERSFERAGYAVRAEWDEELMDLRQGETGIWLLGEGDRFRMRGADDMPLLYTWTALETGAKTIVEPRGANWAADELSSRYGARVHRVSGDPGEMQRVRMEIDPLQARLYQDGIFAALCCMEALRKSDWTITQWSEHMPLHSVRARNVPVAFAAKGRVLRALAREYPQAELSDGARIATERGRVWVRPSCDRAECMVSCESTDMETAAELCDFFLDRVTRAAKDDID